MLTVQKGGAPKDAPKDVNEKRLAAKLKLAQRNEFDSRTMLADLVSQLKGAKSFTELEQETGIDRSTLERWASGDVARPQQEKLKILATYLGVDVRKLRTTLQLSTAVDAELFDALKQPLEDPAGILGKLEKEYVTVLQQTLKRKETSAKGKDSALRLLTLIAEMIAK